MKLIILLLETFGNKFICSVNKILELAEGKCSHPHCNSFYKVSYKPSGCALIISGSCNNGHTYEWVSSKSIVNQSDNTLYNDNLAFATAFVLSRNNLNYSASFMESRLCQGPLSMHINDNTSVQLFIVSTPINR